MPRSARVHPNHREVVAIALKRNGFLTQGDLAAHLEVALSTVNNFCRCVNVSVAKFEEICEALGLEARALIRETVQPASDLSPVGEAEEKAAENFFAYDRMWVGREALSETLLSKLKGSCRLLVLAGISGVGKTAFAERLALGLRPMQLLRENFDDQDQAVDFGSFAARLLEKCAQPVTAEERQNPQQLGRRLAQYLKETAHLVVIDSFEKVLSGGDQGQSVFQDSDYLGWLQLVLSAETCKSRILITSQAVPATLIQAGSRYPNFWHLAPLMGLSSVEQLMLFEKTGFDVHSEAATRNYLERIGQAYSGHPLALRVITGEIGSRPFFGNVAAYWKRYGKEIEAVETALAEAAAGNIQGADDDWQLDRFSRALRQNVRQRLEQTFERLNQEARYAYVLLCESSVYRCAVPEDWWLSHLEFWDCDEQDQEAALEALRDRALVEVVVEQDEWRVKQHTLIRSVSLAHLNELKP
ncbi:MAG: AAA family ATPase [Cyanobacteria bacterium J06649_5]